MKLIAPIIFLMLITLLPGCASEPQRQMTLLPGLTYNPGSEKLSGNFVFLFSHNGKHSVVNNNDQCASLYEFEIASERLSKLADCPDGQIVSASGNGLCVKYWIGRYDQDSCTNVYIYSFKSHQQRNVNINGVPNQTRMVGNHVYFVLEGYNFECKGFYMLTNGVKSEKTIVDYNIAENTLHTVELPGASKWERIKYDEIHNPYGQTNVLHFHYNASGSRLTEGRDYPEGYYSLDVNSGNIHFLSKDDTDDERYLLTAFDGRRIIFTGGGSPMDGLDLVSTEENPSYSEGGITILKPAKCRTLHSFSHFYLTQDSYYLHGMSPDRHYALVMKSKDERSSGTGFIYTYYLVDVTNGNTRMILNDATGVSGLKSMNFIMAPVYLVGDNN
jgi:hypothetical protein